VAQSSEAFDRLLRDRSKALLRTAYLLTGDHQLAEDLVQTSLTKTYLRWGSLRDEAAGEAYVRRVMVTTYTKWWRRKWNGEDPTEAVPDRPGHASDDAFGAADDRDVLRRVLAGLSRRQRACVVMRFYGDLSEATVAAELGISVGTVKSTTSRALARMREAVGGDAPDLRGTESPVVPPARSANVVDLESRRGSVA
jgi:RNA polymerase sigma-70 factor (sigma-E family)